jgi:hypothetical protein
MLLLKEYSQYSVSVNQNIRNTIYYNLITSGGGTKSLIGDTRVDGSLTMTAGDILTGSNILISIILLRLHLTILPV